MSARRRLVGRLLFAVVTVYLVVSLTFGVVVMTPDTNLRGMLGGAAFAGASEEELDEMRQTYMEARGRDAPLLDRYLDWLVDVTLFRWGASPSQGEPVTGIVSGALARTAAYLVPGALASTVAGVALGLRSARHRGEISDRLGRLGSYVLLGLPVFWVAAVLGALYAPGNRLPLYVSRGSVTGLDRFVWTVLAPAGVVAVGLLAGQVSLTRSRSLEHVEADYVRFLRAKGLTERAVSWRILRNILAPVLSLTAAELFSALVLAVVVVEFVFGVEGIGWLTYVAATNNDIPLILGTTTVLAVIGAGGSLVADLASAWLDPRSRSS